jgi:metallophosphoesterase (TIGR00282 family)
LGDIIGSPGRKAVKSLLSSFINDHSVDIVIANGENAAGGFGITEQVAEELFINGVDVITSGNHIFDKKEIINYLDGTDRLIRPANYPGGVPGKGVTIIPVKDTKAAVINIAGLVFMEPILCPFETIINELNRLPEDIKIIIVDFHAEVTSEKCCMGWYLDGKVSALLGTHTHIPTADERILPNGTGYITDAGMTGPYDSVIGIKKENALKRFLLHVPVRFDTAKKDIRLCGVFLDIDDNTGKCMGIKRIEIPVDS